MAVQGFLCENVDLLFFLGVLVFVHHAFLVDLLVVDVFMQKIFNDPLPVLSDLLRVACEFDFLKFRGEFELRLELLAHGLHELLLVSKQAFDDVDHQNTDEEYVEDDDQQIPEVDEVVEFVLVQEDTHQDRQRTDHGGQVVHIIEPSEEVGLFHFLEYAVEENRQEHENSFDLDVFRVEHEEVDDQELFEHLDELPVERLLAADLKTRD